jgi:hypothetical protein
MADERLGCLSKIENGLPLKGGLLRFAVLVKEFNSTGRETQQGRHARRCLEPLCLAGVLGEKNRRWYVFRFNMLAEFGRESAN